MHNDNDDYGNDNDILFDHNVQIEITIFNSLENQIIIWSGDYHLSLIIIPTNKGFNKILSILI